MNIFVLVTPFQLFVVKKIVNQYYKCEENLVVSTIKAEQNYNNLKVVSVSRGIRGLYDTWKLKRFIKSNIYSISFFIPHLGTLFSSYFFELSKEYNRPINVYYEGIAMFYDPIRPNLKAKRDRRLMGALMGIRYQHHEQLYPQELIERVEYCYSPVDSDLLQYKCLRIIDLSNKVNGVSNNILVLSSNEATTEIVDGVCRVLKGSCNDKEDRLIYIKPHYSLPNKMVDYYFEKIKELKIGKVILLDKFQPIEELYASFSFRVIVSQAFSSSLLNAKIIFGDKIKITIYQKETINSEIAKTMHLELE